MFRLAIGPASGNSRRVFAFGRHLDNGVWLTHPSLIGFKLYPWYFRAGFIRLLCFDIHWRPHNTALNRPMIVRRLASWLKTINLGVGGSR